MLDIACGGGDGIVALARQARRAGMEVQIDGCDLSERAVCYARDFAREFGFEHNQYLVFRHRDKPHEHFHIIANRINANGQNTATDKKNYKRIQLF